MFTQTTDFKRAWFIGDCHFGIGANSIEWLDNQTAYFKNFLFPLLKKHYRHGDCFIQLGDLFDNRQTLNIRVFNEVISLFEELSDLMPVCILMGNHDCYNKSTYDVHSLKLLRHIPNVQVIDKPAELHFGKKMLLLVPWRYTRQEELDDINFLRWSAGTHLAMHSEINGFKNSAIADITNGHDLNNLGRFQKVFSGHIHLAQTKGNVLYTGAAYQLNRGDTGNFSGVYLHDFETEKTARVENNYSPKFLKVQLSDLETLTETEQELLLKNNYVDLLVDNDKMFETDVRKKIEALTGQKNLNVVVKEFDTVIQPVQTTGVFNPLELADAYMNNLNIDPVTNETVLKLFKKMYNQTINENQAR